ncbi:acyl-CoA thioesterase [Aestuariibacter salexigens]|uniref:acyl-CoA thioesterase n=1 Tax=Aestuariibacter salexigens TaxID=226010 RepID=UPI0004034AEA|nr:thioesterase family protein [Aestuariibacter salexigens]
MSKPVPLSRNEFSVFFPVQTRWADNDIYGHVNNVTYYAYFDSVINRYLIAEGGLDIHHGNVVGFIVESKCNFFAPIAFPDELFAGVRVKHLGNSAVTYEVGLFKAEQQESCAVGNMTHVFVERQSSRPVKIDGLLRNALSALLTYTN